MDIAVIVTEEKEYSINDVMPACVLEQVRTERIAEQEREKELARLREEARKAKMKETILNSDIIRRINTKLIENGHYYVELGWFNDNSTLDYADQWSEASDKKILEDVRNEELFWTVKEIYEKAGYKIKVYTYSDSYYKDYNMYIFAETNCDTCEV